MSLLDDLKRKLLGQKAPSSPPPAPKTPPLQVRQANRSTAPLRVTQADVLPVPKSSAPANLTLMQRITAPKGVVQDRRQPTHLAGSERQRTLQPQRPLDPTDYLRDHADMGEVQPTRGPYQLQPALQGRKLRR